MIAYFMERVRNWRVIAHVLAPVLWFQATLLITGLYARYTGAQGGRPLEETPFFNGDFAAERVGAIEQSGSDSVAYLFYLVDSVNALLFAAGMASLVAFGLRAARVRAARAWIPLALTLSVGAFDLAENVLLGAALATDLEVRRALGALAGLATGAKFVAFSLAAALAVLGLCAGALAWARGLRRRSPP